MNQTNALPLMEDFYTIQGEGAFSGVPAYFLRLGGCDVGCVWCDVKDSWDASKHPLVTIQEMVDRVVATPAEIAVITGGEPLIYNLDTLTSALKEKGIRTHIETSGAYPLSGKWDWICVSPKKFKSPLEKIYDKAHELKVIVYNKSDFLWAREFAEKVNPNCILLLQPEWSKSAEILPSIIEFVKENPKWRISLQTHKFMDIP